jgi:hypothetical protein
VSVQRRKVIDLVPVYGSRSRSVRVSVGCHLGCAIVQNVRIETEERVDCRSDGP